MKNLKSKTMNREKIFQNFLNKNKIINKITKFFINLRDVK